MDPWDEIGDLAAMRLSKSHVSGGAELAHEPAMFLNVDMLERLQYTPNLQSPYIVRRHPREIG